jgi:hypothetical protein
MKIIIACYTLFFYFAQSTKIGKVKKDTNKFQKELVQHYIKDLEKKRIHRFSFDLNNEDYKDETVKVKIVPKLNLLYDYAKSKILDQMKTFLNTNSTESNTFKKLKKQYSMLNEIRLFPHLVNKDDEYYKFLKTFEEDYRKSIKENMKL